MNKTVVRVDYDNHPNEVAEKFQSALDQLGIDCKQLESSIDDTSLYYEISIMTGEIDEN